MKKLQTKKFSKDSALNSSPLVDFTILGSLLNDSSITSNEDIATLASDSIWSNTPVDLEAFLYEEEYLNLTMRLSVPQLDFVATTSNIFDPPFFTESVLMAGKVLVKIRVLY